MGSDVSRETKPGTYVVTYRATGSHADAARARARVVALLSDLKNKKRPDGALPQPPSCKDAVAGIGKDTPDADSG